MSTRIRNVDLNLLKVFDAVMREQNIGRAATRLCVSQPAISNSLRRLRALYDDELFVRVPKGVRPTPKAQEIDISMREALQHIEDTLSTDDQFRPEMSHRKFTVALTDYGELYFLPKVLQEISRIAPQVDVVCLPTPGATLTLEMKSGAVDLVWDWQSIDDSDYESEVIFEDKSVLIACRDHPEIPNAPTLEQFLELEHVALHPTRTHTPLIERKLERLGLERKVVAEVSHVMTMPAIVATTRLVGCVPERLARFFAHRFELQIHPNPVFEEPVSVHQMWHRNFNADAGHRWFRELLSEIAGSL